MKYILVSGGVVSGIGKGIVSSSLGAILKSCGIPVTCIKIDPYLNIDAGNFSPFEHGEVFVLDDGGEVDLDLGNYERFLDVTLRKDNNITTGKIYMQVIERERRGDYLGKTVQVVPHIVDAIQDWVQRVAKVPISDDGRIPEVCVIELGGTIGDIEGGPFVEAFRELKDNVGKQNFCSVHVSLVPKVAGECKTKPTQHSVSELRKLGFCPDIIICRSEVEISKEAREKISKFCNVALDHVLCVPNLSSVYEVPVKMAEEGAIKLLNRAFDADLPAENTQSVMRDWIDISKRVVALTAHPKEMEVKVALVGKYTKLADAYASVTKALQHAGLKANYRVAVEFIDSEHLEAGLNATSKENSMAWEQLRLCAGVVVPGGFDTRGIDGKILAARWCRENRVPYLGICLGMQTAVVEYARNVLKLHDATSVEWGDPTENNVIVAMPEHTRENMEGQQRVGKRVTYFLNDVTASGRPHSILKKLYEEQGLMKKGEMIEERYRHRYEVDPAYAPIFQSKGFNFMATDESGVRMAIFELKDHPYFVGTQFHPEFKSRPLKPAPPFYGLVLAAAGILNEHLGC